MYLDSDTIGYQFGATFRDAMCPTANELARIISAAEAEVESALRQGGYATAVPSSTYAAIASVPKQIIAATAGVWWRLAHTARGIPLPSPTPADVEALIGLVDRIRTGEVGIEGVSVDTTRAVGGVVFTDSTSTSDDARPQVFGRPSWGGW